MERNGRGLPGRFLFVLTGLFLVAMGPQVRADDEEDDSPELEVETSVEGEGDELKIEIEHLAPRSEFSVLVVNPWTDAFDDLGVVTTDSDGEAEIELKTEDGDPLPFGVASVTDLVGCLVDIVDANGDVVLSATVPPPEGSDRGESGTRFVLPQVSARPGQVASVSFDLSNEESVALAACSIQFDPAMVQFQEPPRLSSEIDSLLQTSPPEQFFFTWFVDNDAGWVQVLLVLDYGGRESYSLPGGGVTSLVTLDFRLNASAPPGNHPLRFTTAATAEYEGNFERSGLPVYNVVRVPGRHFNDNDQFDEDGGTRAPDLHNGVLVSVIGDVGVFQRGDVNLDDELNLADPMRVLSYLFRGGDFLPCEPVADTNVDGRIDLADPVSILRFLFQGVSRGSEFTDVLECPRT